MTDKRMCYFIPTDGHVPDHGYRVSIVVEGKAGHQPTGTWPYSGKPGESMPYFWGDDFDKAEATAKMMNERRGLTERDVTEIVSSSMAKTRQRRGS
jgi:hypothetical protein